MKFDADNGDTGIVRDANGAVIPKPVRGDTHTGWVECFITDGEGKIVMDLMRFEARCVERRYLAPLSIEPLPPGWRHDPQRDGQAMPLEEHPL